jgi:hypothetical protein
MVRQLPPDAGAAEVMDLERGEAVDPLLARPAGATLNPYSICKSSSSILPDAAA